MANRAASAVDPVDLRSIPGLPNAALQNLQALLADPEPQVPDLMTRIDLHVSRFEELARRNEFIIPDEARAVARRCKDLLGTLGSHTDARRRRLACLAAQYFVLEDDADSDFDIGGVDDDAAVVNAISLYLESAGR